MCQEITSKSVYYYLLMLFGNFLFFFPFPSDIFILIFSLIKAAQEVVKNAKKFITLTGGWIFTEKFTNSIKLQRKKKWIRKLDLAALKVGLYMYRDGLEIGLTLAFMSTNRSSSSARRTDAVPLNSFITGRYLKGSGEEKWSQKSNEIQDHFLPISIDRGLRTVKFHFPANFFHAVS